jgi:hypothetical protein
MNRVTNRAIHGTASWQPERLPDLLFALFGVSICGKAGGSQVLPSDRLQLREVVIH